MTARHPVCCIKSFNFSTAVMAKLTYVIEGIEIRMRAKFRLSNPALTRAMSAQSRSVGDFLY